MKLNIPFYKQENQSDCGIAALRMVLNYFGEEIDSEKLIKITDKKKEKGILTIQIAKTSASLDYKTDFYSKQISFNKGNLKHEFYQKYSEDNLDEKSKNFIKEAKNLGVNVQEKTLNLNEILSFVNENSVLIVLLNWNVIKGKKEKGYQGHFVPVVGYDEENIIVHDPRLKNPSPFLKINKKIFDEARRSDGTDEDIVIIHRK